MTNSIIRRTAAWAFTALLVVSFLAGALPGPASAAASASSAPAATVTCTATHVVVEHEKFKEIADKYGVSTYRLAKANNLTLPVSLTVGQKLCIPPIPEPDPKVKWSAEFSGDKLLISGSNFKKQRSFIVKIREDAASGWIKLKVVVSNRAGNLDETIGMPKNLKKKGTFTVCLKDAVTDALYCRQVYRR
jgi:hypothetical protein